MAAVRPGTEPTVEDGSPWPVIAVLVVAVCSGCGGASGTGAPRSAAISFERALAADDGRAACGLLAPGTRSEIEQTAGSPCAQAIVDEGLPAAGATTGSSAFGTMALVRFVEDTVFLAELNGRWRVLAAGCAPVPKAPYDCELQGG